jgi:hypothetical protein
LLILTFAVACPPSVVCPLTEVTFASMTPAVGWKSARVTASAATFTACVSVW